MYCIKTIYRNSKHNQKSDSLNFYQQKCHKSLWLVSRFITCDILSKIIPSSEGGNQFANLIFIQNNYIEMLNRVLHDFIGKSNV